MRGIHTFARKENNKTQKECDNTLQINKIHLYLLTE